MTRLLRESLFHQLFYRQSFTSSQQRINERPLDHPVAFFIYLSLILMMLFMSGGCASKQEQAVRAVYEVQRPIPVRTSLNHNRPDWVVQQSWESEGEMYFVGAFLDGADYPLTIRCANAEAMKVLMQSLSQFVRAEFTTHVQGSNSVAHGGGVDRFVSDGYAAVVDNIHVQGVRQADLYYEEEFSPVSMSERFNVFVMLSMSQADYIRAKADVLKQLRDRFEDEGQVEAKRHAEDLLNRLRDGIS